MLGMYLQIQYISSHPLASAGEIRRGRVQLALDTCPRQVCLEDVGLDGVAWGRMRSPVRLWNDATETVASVGEPRQVRLVAHHAQATLSHPDVIIIRTASEQDEPRSGWPYMRYSVAEMMQRTGLGKNHQWRQG